MRLLSKPVRKCQLLYACQPLTSHRDILRRSQDAWQSLPSWLRVIPSSAGRAESGSICQVSLYFQYNHFLLERTMVRRLHRSNVKLCHIARDLLQLTLGVIAQKEEAGGDAYHISWLVSQTVLRFSIRMLMQGGRLHNLDCLPLGCSPWNFYSTAKPAYDRLTIFPDLKLYRI
jgi:hypothetical protein